MKDCKDRQIEYLIHLIIEIPNANRDEPTTRKTGGNEKCTLRR
jgi:hypothetical protein